VAEILRTTGGDSENNAAVFFSRNRENTIYPF